MDIHFVLVEPAVPENIGFIARALKTMGFSSLRLVNVQDTHLQQGALNTGYQSHDILKSARLYPNLQDAIADVDFVIGTTAKKRVSRHDFFHPTELIPHLAEKGQSIHSVAMVFGSEEHGLTNDEIALCHVLSTVPLATSYPSLNLAQSVMIYAYELSGLALKTSMAPDASEREFRELRQKAEHVFNQLTIDRKPSLHQRMLDRLSLANQDDTHLMLSFIKHLEQVLNNHDK